MSAIALSLHQRGLLKPGMYADVVVFDPDAHWRVTPDVLRSAGKNTPFAGYELLGRARYTLVGGADARRRLAEPTEQTLFWAGEARKNPPWKLKD